MCDISKFFYLKFVQDNHLKQTLFSNIEVVENFFKMQQNSAK